MTLKEASDVWAQRGGGTHRREDVEEKNIRHGCQEYFNETVTQLAPDGMVKARNIQWQNSGSISSYYWLILTRAGREDDVKKKDGIKTPFSLSFFCNQDGDGPYVFRVCLECEHKLCTEEGLRNYYKYLEAGPDLLAGMTYFNESPKTHGGFQTEKDLNVVRKTVEGALSEGERIFVSVGLSFPVEADEKTNRNNIRDAFEKVKPIYDFVVDSVDQNESPAPAESAPAEPVSTEIKKLQKNIILFGAPGTGKTYATNNYAVAICRKDCDVEKTKLESREAVNKEFDDYKKRGQIDFITFHQSYSYEDFVVGLFPKLNSNGGLSYEIKPGAFLRICQKARSDKNNNYVLVVDEINRGNISKIFGELITLIEESRREGAPEQSCALLPYSTKPDGSSEYLSVPSNLYIIGTMNTADRSIQHIDTALRRRFTFIEMKPDASMFEGLIIRQGNKSLHVDELFMKLNERIEAFFDREHVIGQAYFTPLLEETGDDERFALLGEIFANRIIPLLQDYFFDDYKKICYVLGEDPGDSDAADFVECVENPGGYDEQYHARYKVHDLDEEDSPFKKMDGYLKIIDNAVDLSDE